MDDPYDPMVPNDLLQYWEHKALAAEREALERQRVEQLQQQQDLRRQLDLERQREIDQQGFTVERPRGRGRGVSNLPAWMMAQQKQVPDIGGRTQD